MEAAEEQRILLMLLDEIDETLVDFEQRCLKLSGPSGAAELKVAFRAAHNIKGGSRLFGLEELGHFVHEVEELLGIHLSGAIPVDERSTDLLLQAHSVLAEWTHALRSDRKIVLNTSVLGERLGAQIALLRQSGARSEPEAPAAPEPIVVEKASSPPVAAEAVLMELKEKTSEPREGLDRSEASTWRKFQPKVHKRAGNLRVASKKIDAIMELLGELAIHQSILWHGNLTHTMGSDVCRTAVLLSQKVMKGMHGLILSLRMQPVEGLFQRLERAARDLARDLGKKVQIELVAPDVMLDKTVIELMTDPMIHLIRNAVDHGIEAIPERGKSGKCETALIRIEAQQDAGKVILIVADDGAGIDSELVYQKALKKGIVSTGGNLTQDEKIRLIFTPGFSTRDEVTEISGRGVGMDVVQEAVERIGGQITIVSKPGSGTCFQICLPTSLEVIDGILIRVGEVIYIVPMQDIVEILDLNTVGMERLGGQGWAFQRADGLVPVEALADYLPICKMDSSGDSEKQPPKVPASRDSGVALLVRLPNRRNLAFRVDQILAQQQVVVRPLSDKLATVPGFTGATILGNGEPGLILSVSYLGECYLHWMAQARRTA